jgi:hypothetical protein
MEKIKKGLEDGDLTMLSWHPNLSPSRGKEVRS